MEVDAQRLREKALEVITKVVQDDKLHEFTYGTYRKKVEESLTLEPGTLDAPEHKAVVHAIAKDYINRLDEGKEEGEEEEGPAEEQAPKKGKARGRAVKAPPQPRKSRTEGAEVAAPVKKAPKGKRPAARSASVVPTSDEDAGCDPGAPGVCSPPTCRSSASVKAKRVESELQHSVDEPPAKRARKNSPPTEQTELASDAIPSPSAAGAIAQEQKSDSELSVLIDEPPSRKRKKKGAHEDPPKSKAPKGRRRKEPAKELSKDEETIKRLKSFVVACGVRKVWAKEFKELEKPSEQIRRLKQILADLGMTGRMSLDQAKTIRAKREFAQELEDVKEFASKLTSAPPTKSRRQKDVVEKDGGDEGEEESEIEVITKRKTARQSIMAFLGDESD
ncbi:hypothetical protein BC628DRAFT_1350428 [Trametes gibbosa]|nr:hypothetical protein BC628DRAFT_1350428 [Trametes gibbosa]